MIRTENSLAVLLEFFKALADKQRLQIAGLLARQDYSVDEMATILDFSPVTVSHHLRRLVKAGLAQEKAEEPGVYALRPQTLHDLSQQILSDETLQEPENDLDLDAYGRKVLRDYMQEGRLKTIPRQWKKRQVILGYLAEQFEPGRKYTEREVNDIISHTHDDYATLRRELVDGEYMARERDVYWRTG